MNIMTDDGVVFLRPMEESLLQEATMLYNSSMGYATGFDEPVSTSQIRDILLHSCPYCEEFSSGIFICSDNSKQLQFAGLVTGLVRESKLWLKLFAILPRFRRNGIGARAASLILLYCREIWGITGAFLSIAEGNNAGLCFWTSQGFSATGTFRKALFNEEIKQNVLIMNKKCP